jgi:hypothetical protein
VKYKILKTDGTIETLEVKQKLTLGEMQGIVGGLIEYFQHHGEEFVCNEEGLVLNLPRNPHFIDRVIAGNVLVSRAQKV